MPLRRSPCRTPESLTARRANALKSTGPRAPRGKARVSFNALKHGEYAARSARLRERLIRAGYERQEELYGRIRSKIAQAFGTPDRNARQDADRLANVVWCRATRPLGRPLASGLSAGHAASMAISMGTKLESLTKQKDSQCRLPSGQWERSAFGQPPVAPRPPDATERVREAELAEAPAKAHRKSCRLGLSPGRGAEGGPLQVWAAGRLAGARADLLGAAQGLLHGRTLRKSACGAGDARAARLGSGPGTGGAQQGVQAAETKPEGAVAVQSGHGWKAGLDPRALEERAGAGGGGRAVAAAEGRVAGQRSGSARFRSRVTPAQAGIHGLWIRAFERSGHVPGWPGWQ